MLSCSLRRCQPNTNTIYFTQMHNDGVFCLFHLYLNGNSLSPQFRITQIPWTSCSNEDWSILDSGPTYTIHFQYTKKATLGNENKSLETDYDKFT